MLVAEQLQRQLRILQGVIAMTALQLTILIVFDQMVVRIARKGQRVQSERIDGGLLVQTQIGARRHEVRQIEFHHVVSQQECGWVGKGVELVQRRVEIALAKGERLAAVAAYCAELVDTMVGLANLKIERETLGGKC